MDSVYYFLNLIVSLHECEFDYADLEDIVDEYTADIIDILLSDKRLMNELLKKMRSRKIGVEGEKNAKR